MHPHQCFSLCTFVPEIKTMTPFKHWPLEHFGHLEHLFDINVSFAHLCSLPLTYHKVKKIYKQQYLTLYSDSQLCAEILLSFPIFLEPWVLCNPRNEKMLPYVQHIVNRANEAI